MTRPSPHPRLTLPPVTFTMNAEPVAKKRPLFTCSGGKPWTYPARGEDVDEGRTAAAFMVVARTRRPDPNMLWGVEVLFEVGRSRGRKDLDNLIKHLLDALNGWAWKDDRQVAKITATLRRDSDTPRTVCRIYQITEA